MDIQIRGSMSSSSSEYWRKPGLCIKHSVINHLLDVLSLWSSSHLLSFRVTLDLISCGIEWIFLRFASKCNIGSTPRIRLSPSSMRDQHAKSIFEILDWVDYSLSSPIPHCLSNLSSSSARPITNGQHSPEGKLQLISCFSTFSEF